jgi:hypothetical protein
MKLPRFSMRWLMVFVTIVAIICGVLVAPTFVAREFVTKVNSGDFSELYSLEYPDRIWQFTRGIGKYSLEELKPKATLHPMTWRDVCQFRRRVSVGIWPPPGADERLPRQDSSYVFVRVTGAKFGGETWE